MYSRSRLEVPMSSRHWILRMGGGAALAAIMHVAGAAERVLVIDQEGQTRPAFVQFMEGFRKDSPANGTSAADSQLMSGS